MALDVMPINGFVQSVEAGDEATVEPVKADFNFLHGKFDSVAGHGHTGAAGDGQKIGLDGLKQEVTNQMSGKGFELYLIEPDTIYGVERTYQVPSGVPPPTIFNWVTPIAWDGLSVMRCYFSVRVAAAWFGTTRAWVDISFDGINWVKVLDIPELSESFKECLIQETTLPFYFRVVVDNSVSGGATSITMKLLGCRLTGAIV